ncbi:hypothetical protein IWW55_006910, partial [Coemansia sp. RSA 2706]
PRGHAGAGALLDQEKVRVHARLSEAADPRVEAQPPYGDVDWRGHGGRAAGCAGDGRRAGAPLQARARGIPARARPGRGLTAAESL